MSNIVKDIKARMKSVLAVNRVSVSSLSKDFGMNQTTLNRQINKDDAELPIATVLLFINRFGLSADWLLLGNEYHQQSIINSSVGEGNVNNVSTDSGGYMSIIAEKDRQINRLLGIIESSFADNPLTKPNKRKSYCTDY